MRFAFRTPDAVSHRTQNVRFAAESTLKDAGSRAHTSHTRASGRVRGVRRAACGGRTVRAEELRDPQELRDIADDPAHRATLDAFEARLRARLDPEAVDRWAKARQLEIVDRHGGTEAILSRGSMGASPPPGTRFAGHRTS